MVRCPIGKDVVIIGLQVWLPLNSSLNNQGLLDSNIITNNTGATLVDNGKIGRCYQFDGTDDRLYINYGKDILCGELTITMWIKPLSSLNDKMIFGGNTSNQRLYVGVKNNTYNIAYGDKPWGRTTSVTVKLNTWQFIVIKIKDKTASLYCDGKLADTVTASSAIAFTNNFVIPDSNTGYCSNIQVNDIRIYDELISEKYLKLLQQCLVLHYPLNQRDKIINLLKNSDFSNYGSRGYVALNPDLYPTTAWSSYNGGINEPTKNYHAHININTFGYPVIEYNETNGLRNWKGISQTLPPSLTSGNYLLSLDIYQTDITALFGGFYYYNKNGQVGFHSGQFYFFMSEYSTNKWHHLSIATTLGTDVDSTKGINFYIYGYGFPTSSILYITNICLSSSGTFWVPNRNESTTWFDHIEYDTSGYKNNGVVTDTTTPGWSDDSPRYSGCYEFKGNNNIQISHPIFYDDINQYHTVCAWVNLASYDSSQCLINFNMGYHITWGNQKTLMYLNNEVNDSYVYGDPLPLNEWTHITWVLDTSTQRCEVYYNGKLNAKSSNYTSSDIPAGVNKNIVIGNKFKGKLTDLRIYATPLSASDIESLYKTSASVTKNGTLLLAGEVIE